MADTNGNTVISILQAATTILVNLVTKAWKFTVAKDVDVVVGTLDVVKVRSNHITPRNNHRQAMPYFMDRLHRIKSTRRLKVALLLQGLLLKMYHGAANFKLSMC